MGWWLYFVIPRNVYTYGLQVKGDGADYSICVIYQQERERHGSVVRSSAARIMVKVRGAVNHYVVGA